ncbi:hypothetical protein C4N9_21570 [Pararhodobacter marinus]|uniref:Uncharacterized protein n=1 Tax=Pararhodobacter marinus TaxID=2184063 RepID=A0A2U2C3Z2_9RHOB|nr:hypothetical protein [Pararhodobacter marinus]PWE26524.1 hypothetical protein C4N9_21570 [Pararhodobacter marinus]
MARDLKTQALCDRLVSYFSIGMPCEADTRRRIEALIDAVGHDKLIDNASLAASAAKYRECCGESVPFTDIALIGWLTGELWRDKERVAEAVDSDQHGPAVWQSADYVEGKSGFQLDRETGLLKIYGPIIRVARDRADREGPSEEATLTSDLNNLVTTVSDTDETKVSALSCEVWVEGSDEDHRLRKLVADGVAVALKAYDRALPARVSAIQSQPRRRDSSGQANWGGWLKEMREWIDAGDGPEAATPAPLTALEEQLTQLQESVDKLVADKEAEKRELAEVVAQASIGSALVSEFVGQDAKAQDGEGRLGAAIAQMKAQMNQGAELKLSSESDRPHDEDCIRLHRFNSTAGPKGRSGISLPVHQSEYRSYLGIEEREEPGCQSEDNHCRPKQG